MRLVGWVPQHTRQVEQAAHDLMVKKLATEKLDGNNDLVKMLNSLGARAAAFTIRDKQARLLGFTTVWGV